MVKMRRNPEDDYMHRPEAVSNFNESRYYNWFDPQAGMGGWVYVMDPRDYEHWLSGESVTLLQALGNAFDVVAAGLNGLDA